MLAQSGDSSWQGEYELKPNLRHAFVDVGTQIESFESVVKQPFLEDHPVYSQMVGICDSQSRGIQLLSSALVYIWRKFGKFDVSETNVDSVIQEVAEFFDLPTVRLIYWTQLLNFGMEADELSLPNGLRIRRLNESEISEIHGGDLAFSGFMRPRFSRIHEYAIEGGIDEPKVLGDNHPAVKSAYLTVRPSLDRVMLTLRTFKSGQVGYECIHLKPAGFCPLSHGSYSYGDLHVPLGAYVVQPDEMADLVKHTELVDSLSDPAMETACSRLSFAETRTRIQDQIVDAVIGMEALLLASRHEDDRRGELTFRFSMNYSTLFETNEDRLKAFRVAKDLYGLRSRIAHGGAPSEPVRVGSEKISLQAAAKQAIDCLRFLIRRFLPVSGKAPYADHLFWETAYFTLSASKVGD